MLPHSVSVVLGIDPRPYMLGKDSTNQTAPVPKLLCGEQRMRLVGRDITYPTTFVSTLLALLSHIHERDYES